MPAVDQLATSLETLRLRLARTPLPAWGRSMADAALSLLPPAWRRLFRGEARRLFLARQGETLALTSGLAELKRSLRARPSFD